MVDEMINKLENLKELCAEMKYSLTLAKKQPVNKTQIDLLRKNFCELKKQSSGIANLGYLMKIDIGNQSVYLFNN